MNGVIAAMTMRVAIMMAIAMQSFTIMYVEIIGINSKKALNIAGSL